MRLVVGQRVWIGDPRWATDANPVTARSVTEVVGDRAKVAWIRIRSEVPDGAEYIHGSGNSGASYLIYTDDQRVAAELAESKRRQREAITKAATVADLPTLNKIAAALDLPEVVAWTPENPT